MNDLRGRTALVTGAAGGIGREFVLSLLRARANVLAADVSDAGLERLVKTMERDGFGQCLTSRHLDISDHRACATSVEAACERFGALHILINNGALGMGAIRDDHMTNLVVSRPIGSPGGAKLAASRQPAGRPRWFASRPRAPPYHDVSYPCWRRISPIAAASRGMTLL